MLHVPALLQYVLSSSSLAPYSPSLSFVLRIIPSLPPPTSLSVFLFLFLLSIFLLYLINKPVQRTTPALLMKSCSRYALRVILFVKQYPHPPRRAKQNETPATRAISMQQAQASNHMNTTTATVAPYMREADRSRRTGSAPVLSSTTATFD